MSKPCLISYQDASDLGDGGSQSSSPETLMGVRLTVFLPCKEIIHESENHAAGGARILALLAATATILLIVSPTMVQTAKAEEQHLYCVAKDSTKLVDLGKTVSDIAVYTYKANGRYTTLAKDNMGKWYEVDPSNCQTNIITLDDWWSLYTTEPTYRKTVFTSLDAYSAKGYAVISPDYGGTLGIDNDGKAWFITDVATNSVNVNAERTRTLSDSYRFTKIMNIYYASDSTSSGPTPSGGALLIGSQHDTSKTGYVAQMPTSGAPTGLSTVGVTALGLCLLGVCMLSRRRD